MRLHIDELGNISEIFTLRMNKKHPVFHCVSIPKARDSEAGTPPRHVRLVSKRGAGTLSFLTHNTPLQHKLYLTRDPRYPTAHRTP
jgi:hypothetical protein